MRRSDGRSLVDTSHLIQIQERRSPKMAKGFTKILFCVMCTSCISSLLFAMSQINFFLACFSILGFVVFSLVCAWKLASLLSDFIDSSHVNPVGKIVVVTGKFINYSTNTCNYAIQYMTGCDTGFGHELAARLDSLGFHVYATCLDVQSQGALELVQKCSSRLTITQVDVSNEDEIRKVAEEVKRKVTSRDNLKLWAVVNNAGISNFSAVEWGSSVNEIFTKVLMVNLIGSIQVTRSFLPLLKQSPKSRVVFMSSIAGRISFPAMVPYSVSKFGVKAFADGLRRELESSSVNVTMIEPAMFKSPLTERSICMKSLERNFNLTPEESKKFVSPAEVDYINCKVKQYLSSVDEKSDLVVQQMIRAVLDQNPRISYSVYGSCSSYLVLKSLELLPAELQDFVLTSDSLLKNFRKKLSLIN